MLRPKVRFTDNKHIKEIQNIIEGNKRLKAQNLKYQTMSSLSNSPIVTKKQSINTSF